MDEGYNNARRRASEQRKKTLATDHGLLTTDTRRVRLAVREAVPKTKTSVPANFFYAKDAALGLRFIVLIVVIAEMVHTFVEWTH